MTNQEIYETLGIVGADEDTKKQIIDNISTTVQLRFASIVDDMLDEEQMAALDERAEEGQNSVTEWLSENLPEVGIVYEGVIKDHLVELKEQLNSAGQPGL